MLRRGGLALSAAFWLTGVSCSMPAARPSWRDQLVPDSPCYRVNLLDGLDESATTELRDTFSCVDNGHQLDAYQPVIDALEADSRGGVPAGIETARLVNALPGAGIDPWGLAGVAARSLRSEDFPADDLLDLVLEATYARPASEARAGEVTLDDADALSAGLLVPIGPVARDLAGAALDDDLRATAWAGEVLGNPETKRWIRTFGALTASERGEVHDPMAALLPDLGEAIRDTRDASNDVANTASGDSLRDAADVFLLGNHPLIESLAPTAGAILDDNTVRNKLPTKLNDWHRRGHLARVPAELKWLASVDVDGGPLSRSEPSALQALITLLHDTNRPMTCSFDLWVTDLEIDLGNLAVAILDLLAGMNPDLLSGGVSILSSILGWDLSQSLLQDIADSGVCPTLNQNVVINLHTLDLLADPKAYDLLVVTTEGLDVLKKGDDDHIADVADLVTALSDGGGAAPTAELIRDIGDSALMDDTMALVPVLADPSAHGIDIGDDAPADLRDALDLATTLFVADSDRMTTWDRVSPLVKPALAHDDTWLLVGRGGTLLRRDGNRASHALELVQPMLLLDPDLELVDDAATLIGRAEISGPLLRIVETEAVLDAALATTPAADDPVPLAFTTQLIVDGTVDDVLALIHTVFMALDRYVEQP